MIESTPKYVLLLTGYEMQTADNVISAAGVPTDRLWHILPLNALGLFVTHLGHRARHSDSKLVL